MRHRIKKDSMSRQECCDIGAKLNQILNHKLNLLHSDKRTYFYKHKLGSHSIIKTIPLVLSSLALLVVLGGLVNPASLNKVFALGDEEERTIASPNASISFSISNGGVIVGEDDTVSTEVTTGIVSYISNNIAITTKDINKFYVTVQAASGSTSELVGTEHKATIAPVGTNVATDSFGDNTWGYALSDNATSDSSLRYSSLPDYSASTAPQYTSSSDLADGGYNLKLTFAAKINANKPADHYTTKAMVSVVADAKSLPTLEDITYMQDMTPEICANTTTPAAFLEDGKTINSNVLAKQLIDSRDGKSYWVAKLADGNCWMTQNLDLDLYDSAKGENRTLTPEDSNVTENWPSANKPGTGPSTTSGYYDNYYLAQYYDPGYSYYTNNGTTKNDMSEADGRALATNTSGDTNAHSLQGNLYSWTAATAGTGTSSVTSDEASSSICPKGWKLPTSNNTDTTKKSFGGLTTTYSISDNGTGSGLMRTNPFYYIYGGLVINSFFNSVDNSGFYWSSTANGSYNAYNLYLASSGANPSGYYYRYVGFSVRCVAK